MNLKKDIVAGCVLVIAFLSSIADASADWQWKKTDKQMVQYVQDGYAIATSTLTLWPEARPATKTSIDIRPPPFEQDPVHHWVGTLTTEAAGTETDWLQTYILQKGTSVIRCQERHSATDINNSCAELIAPPK